MSDRTPFVANAAPMPDTMGHTYVTRDSLSGDFGTKQTALMVIILIGPLGLRRSAKGPYQGLVTGCDEMLALHVLDTKNKWQIADHGCIKRIGVLSRLQTVIRSPVSQAQAGSNHPRCAIQDNLPGTCR